MSTYAPPDWFRSFMRALVGAYPTWPCTQETVQVYWMTLKDIPQDRLVHALSLCTGTAKYPPAASEIREAARGPRLEFTFAEAWDEMRRNRKLYSPYASQEQNEARCRWSTDAVKRAAESVGWTNMNWLESELPTIRAQFRMSYESLQRKGAEIERHHEADRIVESVRGSIGLRGLGELYGRTYVDDAEPEALQ